MSQDEAPVMIEDEVGEGRRGKKNNKSSIHKKARTWGRGS